MAVMATDPHIGTRIRRARERKRWTQQQLADAIGVNIKSVDNWENGRTRPRGSIGALEVVLGTTLGDDAAAAVAAGSEDAQMDRLKSLAAELIDVLNEQKAQEQKEQEQKEAASAEKARAARRHAI